MRSPYAAGTPAAAATTAAGGPAMLDRMADERTCIRCEDRPRAVGSGSKFCVPCGEALDSMSFAEIVAEAESKRTGLRLREAPPRS